MLRTDLGGVARGMLAAMSLIRMKLGLLGIHSGALLTANTRGVPLRGVGIDSLCAKLSWDLALITQAEWEPSGFRIVLV